MKTKTLKKTCVCALSVLLVAATSGPLLRNGMGGQDGVNIDELVAQAYALDMDNETTLSDPGLSNPWIVGIGREPICP